MTHSALALAALSERLAHENRALVNHKSGRPENVAEHSLMLSLVAPAIAEQYFPKLDTNLVARYATIHDAVEAYVGDTPTHAITDDDYSLKQQLEKHGLKQLKKEFSFLPKFTQIVVDYGTQLIPEARFVRVVDKWMPLLIQFSEGGHTLASYVNRAELLENSAVRARALRRQYPEFSELINVREELARLAATKLLTG